MGVCLFLELGTTKQGTPIRVRSAHGVRSSTAIHGDEVAMNITMGLFLDRKEQQLSSICMPGRHMDNPVAEDLTEVEW